MKMPFGKHKGAELEDVPASYLLWLADQPNFSERNPEIMEYIEENQDGLRQQVKDGNG